jgi:hypothetical protein
VVPVGMAPGGGDHDAMSLTIKPVDGTEGAAGPEKAAPIDIQQRVCFDEKFDQFVDGSSSPAIVIAREGKLKITLRATEETGFLVDRVEIRVYLPK